MRCSDSIWWSMFRLEGTWGSSLDFQGKLGGSSSCFMASLGTPHIQRMCMCGFSVTLQLVRQGIFAGTLHSLRSNQE